MKPMNTKLSPQLVIALCAVAVLLLGAVYYFFVYAPMAEKKADLTAQQLTIQTDLDSLNVKATLMSSMKSEIEILKADNKPIPQYDNLKPVMAVLNGIMMASQQFEISFEIEQNSQENAAEGAKKETLVRRVVTINFLCKNYQDARTIVGNLHDVVFRSQMRQVSLTSASEAQGSNGDEGDIGTGAVQGTVSILFFENI